MKKEFEVISSDGIAVYHVHFEHDSGKLYVDCNCQAGNFGKWCKHKMQLVLGDLSCLKVPIQSSDLSEVLEWVKGSKLAKLVSEMQEAEIEMQNAKVRKVKATKQLEKISRKGA